MKKNKKKKKNIDIENLLYKLCIVTTIVLIVCLVCSETSLARINLDVQRKEKEVLTMKKRLESLEMKIDEMTSLDRIKEISEQYGLSYHSENIRTIK